MKPIIAFTLFVMMKISISAQEVDSRGYIIGLGESVPNFTFHFQDSTARLSDFDNQVVLLQFTASWCGVCRREMPHLEKEIWQEFKNDNFVLIGIDYKESEEKTREFAKTMNITYPLSTDHNGSIFHHFAAPKSGVTRNVLLNKNGEIVFLTRLFDPDEFEALKDEIRNLLNQ